MPPKYASRWQNLGSNSGNMKEYRVVKSDVLEYNGGKWKDITLVERPNLDGTTGTKVTSGLAYKGNTVFDRNPEINAIVNATVLGIGTNEPFSRISLGSNKGDGIFDNAKTMGGQNAAIAIHENSDGRDFKGFVYDQQIEAQLQPTNELVLTNALGIFSNISTTNFSLLDHNILENENGSLLNREKLGGRFYLTDDDRVVVGGKPRIGLEGGSQVLTTYDEIKVKLDVRGSIRTQGYINFLNYSSNDPLNNQGGYDGWLRDVDNKANFASRNNDPTSPNVENIPRGSIWLGLDRDFIPDENTTISSNQPSLYFKDSNGSIQKIQTKQDAGDKLFSGKISSINEQQTFGFIFNESTENDYPVRFTLSGERFEVDIETKTDPSYFKNALTIRTGNVAITGVHGSNNEVKTSLNEETQIKPFFFKNDLIGGKFWVERQQGIGPNQYDKLYSMLNIETLEKIPTLVSCKTWNTYTYEKASFKELGESLIIEIEYEIPLDADNNPDLTVDELANKFLDVGLKLEINSIPDAAESKMVEGIHFISEISQTSPTFQYQLTADKVLIIDDSVDIVDDDNYFIIPIEREIINGALIFPYNQFDIINLLGVLPDDLRNGIHYVAEIDTDNDTIKILKNYEDFDFTIDEEKRTLKIFDFNFNPPDATNSIILVDEPEKNFSELSSTIDNINARNCFMFGSIHDVNIKNSIIGGSLKNTVSGESDSFILGGGNTITVADNLTVIGNNNTIVDLKSANFRLLVGDNDNLFKVDKDANVCISGNLDVFGVGERDGGKGNLNVNGSGDIGGDLTVIGNGDIRGSLEVGIDALIQQNLTVNGDFTVNGSTTTIDTVNTTIEDNIIELARNTTDPATAKDSGILIQRGGDNAFMGFCEQEGKFVMCITNANGDFDGSSIPKEAATLNVFELEFSNAKGTKLSIQDKITDPSQYYLTVNKNSDGYVGIGIQNPNHKLHVNDGVFAITGNTKPGIKTNDAAYFWHQQDVGPTISGNKFQVRTGNTEKNGTKALTINENGWVGIGSEDDFVPTSMLHLQSTTSVVLRMEADKNNVDDTGKIGEMFFNPLIFMSQDGSDANYFKIGMVGEPTNLFTNSLRDAGFLHSWENFQIATAGAARLTIDETGNVGIGSNDPKSKLHIEDGVLNITGNTKPGIKTNDAAYFWHQQDVGPTISGYKFQVRIGNDEKNGTEAMTIDENGNVGIGTLAPQHKLHVNNGVLNITGNAEPDVTTNDAAYFWHQVDVGPTISGKKFQVRTGANEVNGTEAMIIDENGNVGIGITDPATSLVVRETTRGGIIAFGDKDIITRNTDGEPVINTNQRPGIYFAKDSGELSEMSFPNIYTYRPNEAAQQLYYKHNEHRFYVNNSFISGGTTQTHTGDWTNVMKFGLGIFKYGNVGIGTSEIPEDNTKLQIYTSSSVSSSDFSPGRTGINECLRLTGRAANNGGAFIRFTNAIPKIEFPDGTKDSSLNTYTGGAPVPAIGELLTYNIAGIHGYDPDCSCWSGNLGFYTSQGGNGTGGTQLKESMTIEGKTGNVGIGTTEPVVSLDIKRTDAIRIPVGTKSERPSVAEAGLIRYNSSFGEYEVSDGSGWGSLATTLDSGRINELEAAINAIGADDYVVTGGEIRVHKESYKNEIGYFGEGAGSWKVTEVPTAGSPYATTETGPNIIDGTYTPPTPPGGLPYGLRWSSITISDEGSVIAATTLKPSTDPSRVASGKIWISTNAGNTWSDTLYSKTINARGPYSYTQNAVSAPVLTHLPSMDWKDIDSSGDGRMMAAVVYGGRIWRRDAGGGAWREMRDEDRYNDVGRFDSWWQNIIVSQDGTRFMAVESGTGGKWNYSDTAFGNVGGNVYTPISSKGNVAGGGGFWRHPSPSGYPSGNNDTWSATQWSVSYAGEGLAWDGSTWAGLTGTNDLTTVWAIEGLNIWKSSEIKWTAGDAAANGYAASQLAGKDVAGAYTLPAIIWTKTSPTSTSNGAFSAISGNLDGLAACVDGGNIYTSIDGTTWKEQIVPGGAKDWKGISRSGKMLVACEGGNVKEKQAIWISSDGGINWTILEKFGALPWTCISLAKNSTRMAAASAFPAGGDSNSSLYLGSGGGSFGDDSTTIGYLPTASGEKAIAMGITTNASGYGSIALGNYSVAAGPLSVAIGNRAYAGPDVAFAIGANGTTASALAEASMNNNALVIYNNKSVAFSGDITAGTITSNGITLYSDDRIKHNEQPIVNALSIISKLTPKHYIKTSSKLYDASHNFQLDSSGNPLDPASGNPLEYMKDYNIETGIIAQEIKNIPELKFVVHGNEETNTPLNVDYNSIHCTHIAATQEIDKIQQEEKTKLAAAEEKISALEKENATLKSQLTSIEARLAALEA